MSKDVQEILEQKMQKTIAVLKDELNTVRAGRANPALLDRVVVDYYGSPTPLKNLSNISVPDPRTLMIAPFDPKTINDIEKAINVLNLGINPTNDGKLIRVVLPELTEERRKEYIKVARTKAEDAKISMRSVRRHAKDQLEKLMKDGEAGEDDVRRAEKQLDDVTGKHVAHVDDILKHKEAELLEV